MPLRADRHALLFVVTVAVNPALERETSMTSKTPPDGADGTAHEMPTCITTQTCVGYLSQAWAMSILQKALSHVEGVQLAWGRESSPHDGALVITGDGFPTDPLTCWDHCLKATDEVILFDVKTGYGLLRHYGILIIVLPSELSYVHIVPGRLWWEAAHKWRAGRAFILSQCAVKLDDLPKALQSLVAASRSSQHAAPHSPRKWYTNPTTGVEFDGWSVPPPSSMATFTYTTSPTHRLSDRSINRMWRLLGQDARLSLHDNLMKPLIADLVLCYTGSTGERRQFFVEHKASNSSEYMTLLEDFVDPKFDWHVLANQVKRQGNDAYNFILAHDEQRIHSVEEGQVTAFLSDTFETQGHEIREALQKRWSQIQRDHSDAEEEGEEEVKMEEDEDGDDDEEEEEEEEGGVGEQDQKTGAGRQWRVKSTKHRRIGHEWLNDQSWSLGQNLVLYAGACNPYSTSFFVQHTWSDEERLAYETSRTLPRPKPESKAIPLSFGRRLYDTVTGERQYLKASVHLVADCSKIKPVFIMTDSMSDMESFDKVTLHATKLPGHCDRCDSRHQHMQWTYGPSKWELPSGTVDHAQIVDRIGRCLGTYSLKSGTLWQRCADLFDEPESCAAHTLQDIWQSTWRHGLRRVKEEPAPVVGSKRWAPCNACWSEKQLCDTSEGACRNCTRNSLVCQRKRCAFYDDPEACGDPFCSEVHLGDAYHLLTYAPRDPKGGDAQKDVERREALSRRIPVCSHCWENGWHLLCSPRDVCHMCTLFNANGSCMRPMCAKPHGCTDASCSYAHSDFGGGRFRHQARKKRAAARPPSMRREDLKKIAKDRGQALKTVLNRSLEGPAAKRPRHHIEDMMGKVT